MKKFIRKVGYLLVIMLLLPYVVTIFINGEEVLRIERTGSPYVKVEREGNVKEISLDTYGIGVLAKEMDANTELEALKAQAVLIRTSIYKTLQEEGTSTVLQKNYWTRRQMLTNWGQDLFEENYARMRKAWENTDRQVLIYEGNLALTPYHKLSNGKTRSGKEALGTGAYAYLQVRECPEDLNAEGAKTVSVIQESGFQVLETDSAGYVTKMKCGAEEVNGEEFRSTYHLASSSFVLEDFDGKTRVTAQGIGHGLGMSQYTANFMAKEGKNYKEILNYFFEGTTFEEVAEILVNPE